MPREVLLPLFWPGLDAQAARHGLRNTLLSIRKALGPAAIVTGGADAVGLAPGALWCDAVAFAAATENGGSSIGQDILALYRGPFLDGLAPGDVSASLEQWVDARRGRLARALAMTLERLAADASAEGNAARAVDHLRMLVDLDPLAEAPVSALVSALAAAGRAADARRLARQFVLRVRSESGGGPSPEFERLLERVAPGQERAVAPVSPDTADNPAEHPFVGRGHELELLRGAWTRAGAGRPQVVLIEGVAGIGKTRLAEEVIREVADAGGRTARARSWAAEGRLAYGPLADLLRTPTLRAAVTLLEPTWQHELTRILPELVVADQPAPLGPDEGWQRRRLFEAIVRAIEGLGEPLLVLIDDLQWCDDETLAWMGALAVLAPRLPLLLIGTARADELPPEHPLHEVPRELDPVGAWSTLELRPLDEPETLALAKGVSGRELDAAGLRRLHRYAGGSPLIVVESIRSGWLESMRRSPATDDQAHAPQVPARVRAVMAHRLAQLTPAARRVADLMATAGREVEVALLARALDLPASALVDPLDDLWRHRILRPTAPGRWDFTHDRLREVAYASVAPAHQADSHRRIAEALAADEATDPMAVSAQLALHWERAGNLTRALEARERAAAAASRVHAHPEAARHLVEAIRLLRDQPESATRDLHEAELQVRLGDASVSASGWAAGQAGAAYRRALDLARPMDQPRLLGCAISGFNSYCHVRADFDGVRAMGRALDGLARQYGSAEFAALSTYVLGLGHFHRGELEQSRELLITTAASAATRLSSQYGIWTDEGTIRVITNVFLAHVQCLRGRARLAEAALTTAGAAVEEGGSPFPHAIHACYAAMYWCFRDDPVRCGEQVAIARQVSEAHEIPYYRAWAAILDGWIVARTGQPSRGVELLREGLSNIQATGSRVRWPFYLGLIAEAQARAGSLEEALATLDDAERVLGQHREDWCRPGLHQVRAEVLAAAGDAAGSHEAAQTALEVGEAQGAHLTVLRSVGLLARLELERGERTRATDRVRAFLAQWPGDPDLRELQRLREIQA